MDKQNIKRWLEGAAIGCIALSVLLFGSGWAVRSDTAAINARQMSRAAVVDSLADICVAQYEHAANAQRKLREMKSMDSWKRGDYVGKQGWATMPGNDTPTGIVADECAVRLAKREVSG